MLEQGSNDDEISITKEEEEEAGRIKKSRNRIMKVMDPTGMPRTRDGHLLISKFEIKDLL